MITKDVMTDVNDPVNAAILSVSEDCVQGFDEDPFGTISKRSGVELPVVLERIKAMLQAGVIRRVRQTLLATNLANGALVAWQIDNSRLDEAFDFMSHSDPFSGHVVIRTADPASPGAQFRLWTTLKVPQGFSIENHCDFLLEKVGALSYKIMPARYLFVLGVGHMRRKNLPIGSMADVPAEALDTRIVELSEEDWKVLIPLKRELEADEVSQDLWKMRAIEAGLPLERFISVARTLNQRGVVGRFSTFLEHVKPNEMGERNVTRYNALFHWAVPAGMEMQAGQEIGRFHIMTHAYWREGGEEFRNVNIMGVAHGMDKAVLLAHKEAMDAHLRTLQIPVSYTNVFWGGRSEIKPSEISPIAYMQFCETHGIHPGDARQSYS